MIAVAISNNSTNAQQPTGNNMVETVCVDNGYTHMFVINNTYEVPIKIHKGDIIAKFPDGTYITNNSGSVITYIWHCYKTIPVDFEEIDLVSIDTGKTKLIISLVKDDFDGKIIIDNLVTRKSYYKDYKTYRATFKREVREYLKL